MGEIAALIFNFFQGWSLANFLFGTKHDRDLERGGELLLRAINDSDIAAASEAIDYFRRIDADDKKYAQCISFIGLVACNCILANEKTETAFFQEGRNCLKIARFYLSKIPSIETNLLTINSGVIKDIQASCPEFDKLIDRLETYNRQAEEEYERQRQMALLSAGDQSGEVDGSGKIWKIISIVLALIIAGLLITVICLIC